MVKKRRSPFGFGFGDEFFGRDIFDEMERMMREMGSIDFEDVEKKSREGKSFVKGYSITIGPDGKPVVRQFGDKPATIVEKSGKGTVNEEREPLVDIIEDKDTVTIMAEVPGVSKEDIKLTGGENHLEINVDTAARKYHKKVDLPCGVKLMTARANYKNGVLEVVIDRIEKKKDEKKGGKEIKIN